MSRERVDALISRICRDHLGESQKAQAKYYQALHEQLAPLARLLEKDIQDHKTNATLVWNEKVRTLELQQAFYQQLLAILYNKDLKPADRLQALARLIEPKLKEKNLAKFRNASQPLLENPIPAPKPERMT